MKFAPAFRLLSSLILAFTPIQDAAAAPASPPSAPPSWPQHHLAAQSIIPLTPPDDQRFDASGLLHTRDGVWLAIRDRGAGVFTIQFPSSGSEPAASLVPFTACFTDAQFAAINISPRSRLDGEGLAQDAQGRLYLCEESQRLVLRCDPALGKLERLPIDWSPVTNYFSADRNASFEGIAVGPDRLYLANERAAPLIVAIDLSTLKIVDHFSVFPRQANWLGTHYSDLAWFQGRLFVLCRQNQVILEIDPARKTVVQEYNYAAIENRLGYGTRGWVGLMEGLAVDQDFFWLLVDNNGLPRGSPSRDTRPVLIKSPRPRPGI